MNYAEIIGNGTANDARSNARALDWEGNEYLKGDLYVGCSATSTGGTKIIPLPVPPVTNGTYILQCTVNNGTVAYSWIKYTTQANVPTQSVTNENGDTIIDESGNYITYDI